jgi:hypothetical protein
VSAGPPRCRACTADLRDGALRCDRCGAPRAGLGACPHCRGEGGLSPHAELRFSCDLCGGPRIPHLDPAIPSSGRDVPLLQKAAAARKHRALWRTAAAGGGVALAVTLVPLVITMLVAGPRLFVLGPGAVFTALFGGLLATALTKAGQAERAIAPALDGAWLIAATDISLARGSALTTEHLSRALAIEEPQAEELLALVDVTESTGVVSTRGARLRFEPPPVSVGGTAPVLDEARAAEEADAADPARQVARRSEP